MNNTAKIIDMREKSKSKKNQRATPEAGSPFDERIF